jgi:mono/diheme cytochrome c family protein
MKQLIIVSVALVLSWGACAPVLAQTSAKPSPNSSKKDQPRTAQGTPTEGEKRFQVNCGRCHNPPEAIAPREARAVTRHMRVRAMLSAEDEKLILKFLAP